MSRVLKYNEAKLKIAQMIGERGMQVGDKLPPERELAKLFGVSIISIRRAFEELKNAGILERVQGVGSFFTGKIANTVFHSTLGIISINDPRFPSGNEIFSLREALKRYEADYRIFNVGSNIDTSISERIAKCDRLIVSGFVNLPWLDFLSSQGKPLVQIGISEHTRPVSSVQFDWEAAFDRSIKILKAKGKKRIGLLLIHPVAANCSFERSRLFLQALKHNGYRADDDLVRFVVPEKAIEHVTDYMNTYGLALDALLIDYHVFNIWTFAFVSKGFHFNQEIVILQTIRELRDEMNYLNHFAQLYFPYTILEKAIEILYEYPYSFIEQGETLKIEPTLEGLALQQNQKNALTQQTQTAYKASYS